MVLFLVSVFLMFLTWLVLLLVCCAVFIEQWAQILYVTQIKKSPEDPNPIFLQWGLTWPLVWGLVTLHQPEPAMPLGSQLQAWRLHQHPHLWCMWNTHLGILEVITFSAWRSLLEDLKEKSGTMCLSCPSVFLFLSCFSPLRPHFPGSSLVPCCLVSKSNSFVTPWTVAH